MRTGFPKAIGGQTIGLLGGSFDPPHAGHLHVSREAMKRFRLDRVWWLVSPGNPLKRSSPADLRQRLAACQNTARDRRITVTDLEAQLGTHYTAQTLTKMLPAFPHIRFVWLMGADNLAQFHHWEDWLSIARTLPIGVLARPGAVVRAGLSPAARALAPYRLPEAQSGALAHRSAPAWCLAGGPTVDISSTQIRNRGEWVV